MKTWALAAIGAALILIGSALAAVVQTSGGKVEVRDVRYPAADGAVLSGLLYVPKTATAENPAPAILASHGLINTREMQSAFAIELSRRGYVVLAIDMSGHGYSQGALGQNGNGGPGAFAYLSSLPFVDKSAIGMEGHSMGGSPVLAAARANPDGYRSIVLEGSTITIGGRRGAGAPGQPQAPLRNVAVVFGQYDEFPTMWRVEKGSDVPNSKLLQGFFGTTARVEPGKLYGSIEDGTGRMLVNPAVNHPQEHFTRAGVAPALDWFARTVPGAANPIPSGNQVWLWKEFGTLAGFVGCVLLILGVFRGLLSVPAFAGLSAPAEPAAEKRGARWLLAFALAAAVPALTYFPLMTRGSDIFFGAFGLVGLDAWARGVFTQNINNQLVVWAIANGLIAFAFSFVLRAPRTGKARLPLSLAAAFAAVAVGYLSLVLVDALFKVDYRFWVLGLKPLDGRRFGAFLLYLLPFALFFWLALRTFAAGLAVRGERTWTAALIAGLAMSLGFMVMLGIQYGVQLSTGVLWRNEPLLTIVAYQFVPLLFVIGVIAAVTWRWTGSYAPGAVICTLFITWYVVSGTAFYPARPAAPAGAPAAAAKAAP